MNAFEAKRAARVESLMARAARAKSEGAARLSQAHEMADRIPFGQPILVGHHSERRHRRDVARIASHTEAGFALLDKADSLAKRAKAAEANEAISSDDPDAVEKLRAKLEQNERIRARMRAANAIVRKGGPNVSAALAELGFDERWAGLLLSPDPMGRLGFPGYALQNTGAESARLRKRIAELEARRSAPAREPVATEIATVSEADNRVRIVFPGRPAAETRDALKGRGFRWAPSVGAWQRQASSAAWFAALQIVGAS